MAEQFVIVGAGLAGAKAAETLRKEGFEGRIALIGAEDVRPYERPPLSKGALIGTSGPDEAFVHARGWYQENKVDLRIGVRATSIDRGARTVTLSDGSAVTYDRLLLCTGARPRELNVPGAESVRYLRTMADSAELSRQFHEGTRVVVIGAGWIGLEVAAAARTRGCAVSVVEMANLPLQRVLGDEVGTVFAELHRANGVTIHFGVTLREIRTEDGETSVVLGDGTVIPADLVVVGVGVQPNVELAEAAGLTIDNGIVVDSSLRSSDPVVFACGDVASYESALVGSRIRVEHWENAKEGGKAAARAMLGQADTYANHVPYFYTDQFDLGMEYCGYVAPGGYDSVVFRGDPSIVDGKAPAFVVFWLQGGRVLAAMNVNIWDVQPDLVTLVRAGHAGKTVDPAQLADPSVPLGELAV